MSKTEFTIQLIKIFFGLLFFLVLLVSLFFPRSQTNTIYMICGQGFCWQTSDWKFLPFRTCVEFLPPEDEPMIICGDFTINRK